MSNSEEGHLNQAQIAESLAEELDLPTHDVAAVLTGYYDMVVREVTKGNRIVVTNFGTFYRHTAPSATRRNPQTGEPVHVPERKVLKFKASPRSKDIVDSGDATARRRKMPKSSKSS